MATEPSTVLIALLFFCHSVTLCVRRERRRNQLSGRHGVIWLPTGGDEIYRAGFECSVGGHCEVQILLGMVFLLANLLAFCSHFCSLCLRGGPDPVTGDAV